MGGGYDGSVAIADVPTAPVAITAITAPGATFIRIFNGFAASPSVKAMKPGRRQLDSARGAAKYSPKTNV